MSAGLMPFGALSPVDIARLMQQARPQADAQADDVPAAVPPGFTGFVPPTAPTMQPQVAAAAPAVEPEAPARAPLRMFGSLPPQMPAGEPSVPARSPLPSLVGSQAPAVPARAPVPPRGDDEAPAAAAPARPLTFGSLPAPTAPATTGSTAAPAAPAAPAPASPASEPSLLDRIGNGLRNLNVNGGGDLLTSLGIGLMSTPGFGRGAAAGLKAYQDNEGKRAASDLARAEFGLKVRKDAQEQRQLTGNAQYVTNKIPGISPDQALTLGGNPTFMNELFKGILPPSELYRQYTDDKGNTWSQNTRTGQSTVALKADDDKTQRPLTDPAERAKYGIAADDPKPYQVDANNKVSAIGGGGTSVSVDLGKKAAGEADAQILKKIDTSYDKAQGAIGTLGAISRQKQALDQGIIAGWGSNLRTNAQAMAEQLLGITPDEKLSPTYTFDAASKQKGAELAKAISQAGHTTNMDLNLGNTIAGGDRDKTERALRSIIDAQELLARDTITRHNSGVDKYIGSSPDMKDRMGWYHVEAPDVYRYGQGTPNPVADPGSVPAAPTRSLNGKTYSKGPDGHWYEAR